ncbi:MAG: AmmeMemoRadiSam system protein B [bacterium]|nr:AmmeMemoRadiSam system protein B [bacterium]
MVHPALRQIEATPIDNSGEQGLMLRDPFHLSDAVLVVSMAAVPILQRLDGRHSLEEIRSIYKEEYRADVSMEQLRDLVDQLEKARFLEGERFDSYRGQLFENYMRGKTRPSFLAGRSYEAEPDSLRSQLKNFFTHEDGPGLPGPNGAVPENPLRGLIVPHIDFPRGGTTFAWSYRALAERSDADLYIVLGTCHAPMQAMYGLTRKGFETPFGVLEVDADFVGSLAERAPEDLFQDEFAHRAEHSIEFQAVFLRYLHPERPIRFVPILVGSFGEFIHTQSSPAGSEKFESFLAALQGAIGGAEESGRKVCLLASVDLAHVGPQFGDAEAVDAEQLAMLAQEDRASLDAVCRGDAEAFYWSVAKDGDRRKVCGLAPIYTILRALENCRGEVLRYSQWPDPNGTVTFCSMALH